MSKKLPTMDDIGPLLDKYVPDGEARAQLRRIAESRMNSPLARETLEARAEAAALQKEERLYTYRAVGVPESAHELLDQVYDGRPVTVESIADLAQTHGFQVEGVTGKGPEPGDPGYVWSSPAERHMWEQENE